MKNLFTRRGSLLFAILLTVLAVSAIIYGCNKDHDSNNLPINYKVDLVSKEVAKSIAENFDRNYFRLRNNTSSSGRKAVTSSKRFSVKNDITVNDSYDKPVFYIFNYEQDSGYIIISADYKQVPVLAFVDKRGHSTRNCAGRAY